MTISLRSITKNNYDAICDIDVAKHQQDLLACNMYSLVESFFNEGYITRAIYQHDKPVGFFMWVEASSEKTCIWRFMVDEKFQQQGIGTAALSLALEEIKARPTVKSIEICYKPDNPVAKSFYARYGFIETGMDSDGEDMLAIITLP